MARSQHSAILAVDPLMKSKLKSLLRMVRFLFHAAPSLKITPQPAALWQTSAILYILGNSQCLSTAQQASISSLPSNLISGQIRTLVTMASQPWYLVLQLSMASPWAQPVEMLSIASEKKGLQGISQTLYPRSLMILTQFFMSLRGRYQHLQNTNTTNTMRILAMRAVSSIKFMIIKDSRVYIKFQLMADFYSKSGNQVTVLANQQEQIVDIVKLDQPSYNSLQPSTYSDIIQAKGDRLVRADWPISICANDHDRHRLTCCRVQATHQTLQNAKTICSALNNDNRFQHKPGSTGQLEIWLAVSAFFIDLQVTHLTLKNNQILSSQKMMSSKK